MASAARKTTTQDVPGNHDPNHSAKRVVTPVSFSTPPIINSPPYQTKTSHAECSLRALSQLSARVTNNTVIPRKATTVGESQLIYDEATQNPISPMKTRPTIASRPRMGPSAASCSLANCDAAGVRLSSGDIMR